MEALLEFLKPLVEVYGGKIGWLPQVITIIGSIKMFVRPVMDMVEAYVKFTPNKKDDLRFKEIKDGKIVKSILYFLDWCGLIRIKK